MQTEEKIKLFKDVFAPKPGEKVLFLIDVPNGDYSEDWMKRRQMAEEWHDIFKQMGEETGFSVEMREYPATGRNNAPLPTEIIKMAAEFNLIIAITEHSATSSLLPICSETTRAASMPNVKKEMEDTALSADYTQIKIYAEAIKEILNKAVGAEITFSSNDFLYLDLSEMPSLYHALHKFI